MAKPFESRIQDLVYNVEVGVGLRIVKTCLYLIFVAGVSILYIANGFKGLREAEAMEYAQLARNFARTSTLQTNVVRPGTIYHLVTYSKNFKKIPEEGAGIPLIEAHPDIIHPPVYPVALGTLFKLAPKLLGMDAEKLYRYDGKHRHRLELWVIVPFGVLLCWLSGGFLYLLAKRLFDQRVALLSMTLYFLSNVVWHDAISGMPVNLVVFLTVLAMYTATVAAQNRSNATSKVRWLIPWLICSICVPLAFLTHYTAFALLPCMLMYIGFAFRQHGYLWAVCSFGIFLLLISPWIARNLSVAGTPFGFAPQTCYSETRFAMERRLAPPEDESERRAQALRGSIMSNLKKYYEASTSQLGNGILTALFVTTFFFRFLNAPTQLLRWGVLAGMFTLLIGSAVWGAAAWRIHLMFWPIVIVYGVGFFYLLLDRLEYGIKFVNMLIVSVVIILSALPLIIVLMPPREDIPNPPYDTPKIENIARTISSNELLCTDMPWATSWYGNANSLLLPHTLDEYYNINDYTKYISGLYLTSLTLDKPYLSSMSKGSEASWFILSNRGSSADFPLQVHYQFGTVIYRTDRNRLEEVFRQAAE